MGQQTFPSPPTNTQDSFSTSEIVPAGLVGNKSTQVFLGQSVPWNTEESSRLVEGQVFSTVLKKRHLKKHKKGRRNLTTN